MPDWIASWTSRKPPEMGLALYGASSAMQKSMTPATLTAIVERTAASTWAGLAALPATLCRYVKCCKRIVHLTGHASRQLLVWAQPVCGSTNLAVRRGCWAARQGAQQTWQECAAPCSAGGCAPPLRWPAYAPWGTPPALHRHLATIRQSASSKAALKWP